MRKLKKLNLHETSVLSDNEMKNVVGGNSWGCTSNGIMTCSGTCTVDGQMGMCRNTSTNGWGESNEYSWGYAWDYQGYGSWSCSCQSLGGSYGGGSGYSY